MSPKKDELEHYGVPRRSGRYPWGSGDDPQRNPNILSNIKDLQKKGVSEADAAKGLGIKTTKLRAIKSLAKAEKRSSDSAEALRLHEKGLSNVAIGQRMGKNESSIRALLNPSLQAKSEITAQTSHILRNAVKEKKYIDVGAGVETQIGISRTKLDTAVSQLQDEGYQLYYVKTEQLGTGKFTSIKVLADKDVKYAELYKNRDQIKTISDHSEDGGRSFLGLNPVENINSDRIHIRYLEDGGGDKDGVIELRRGVEDISLGNSKYAQVRIGVDGTHYMKGMAMYSTDIPKGKDIVYNTKKDKTVPKQEVFKPMKRNPDGTVDTDNPFGSAIKPNGQRRALNVVNEEGDWETWSKNLSSQVLSKQSPILAKRQLGLALDIKKDEFDELSTLTNPAVKKRLLESFADDVDSASVHLKAAALPRQSSHVILPLTSLKENEIYAPSFNNGEIVVLIRHPHGGPFEIPELTVNNRNPEANKLIKGAKDAVGINPKVAARLSGADFDGDSVLVIPNKDRHIRTSPGLKALKDFDPITAYPPHDGMITVDGGKYEAKTRKVDYGDKKPRPQTKQMKMGEISNLITDMTIKGANEDEIARAVRHSMVVIDSEKHHLDYKQSALDNNIAALKKKYQGGERSGASTLISRAGAEVRINDRTPVIQVNPLTGKKKYIRVDPLTGRKVYQDTNSTFVDRKGKIQRKTLLSTRMAETHDARSLSSGTRIENIYAAHANDLKALANKARLMALGIRDTPYSPSAKAAHSKEVDSLKAKLNLAFRNKPLERQAQLLANKVYSDKLKNNPHMDPADKKKIRGQALEEARARMGAHKPKILITDEEWKAIQLGAISTNILTNILLNTDLKILKQRATPRTSKGVSIAKVSRAKLMLSEGYTIAEVSGALGVSVSTLKDALN